MEILSTAVVSSNSLLLGLGWTWGWSAGFLLGACGGRRLAALWCRGWRLVPSVAASLLAARRVAVGVGVRPLERLGRGQWPLKGSGISYKLPLIHGAASHHLKRNYLPLTQQPAGFNP